MAETYLALSGDLPGLRTLVVVKRILPHLSENEQFVRMFFDEARIGALLDHPNIPRIIEVGQDDDGYFLAMEAVPGKPLSAILRRALRRKRPLAQANAAFIVGRAAAALGYAHALSDADDRPLNIVHRDVSPENILVSFEGAVKMIDFGIASAHGRVSRTVVGGLKGKVEYMSPEQAVGAPVDRRSDVFSLGIVLWEALSGRRLFRRETDLAVMRAISDEPIPRPSGALSIPPRLERIVMTALERAPEDRFQDAHEMALLLERHAFATESFDPAELVAHVKQLFPSDYTGWKATLGLAQAVDGPERRTVTAAFPPIGGVGTRTGEPTLALHQQQRDEVVTRAERVQAPPAEPEPELASSDGSELPHLASWGGAQPDPASDGGEASPETGDDAAAYAALRAWTSRRRRLPRPMWLLLGAAASAAILLVSRPNMLRQAPPPARVGDRAHAALPGPRPPLIEPTAEEPARTPPAASEPATATPPMPAELPPLASPAPAEPPAEPPVRRVPVRAVRGPARKRAVAQRQHPSASRPPAPPPAAAPQSPVRAPSSPWHDPFE